MLLLQQDFFLLRNDVKQSLLTEVKNREPTLTNSMIASLSTIRARALGKTMKLVEGINECYNASGIVHASLQKPF